MLSKLSHTELHHLPYAKHSRSSPSCSRSSPRTVSFPFPFLSLIHIAHFSVRSSKFLSPIHPHFSVKIFTSSHFRTHMQREREREREREERATTSTLPTNLEPRSRLRLRRSTNPRTDLRLRTFDPSIYEPMNRSSTQSL